MMLMFPPCTAIHLLTPHNPLFHLFAGYFYYPSLQKFCYTKEHPEYQGFITPRNL